jgi:hypothetical protein
MNEFWIVRFVRKDGKPDEEYFYHSLADAEHHRDLFLNDDSGLYEKIELINGKSKEVTMELNFIKSGDYYIPDIKLSKPNIRLGKWGRMRREFLRQAHPIVFSEMVLTETLYEHCAEIESAAKSRMEVMLPQLMQHYGVTEQLKAENQMEWVRQMNACVAQVEEVIKYELIYTD